MAIDTYPVTVCDACLCASCWQGIFYCQQYKTAGTKQMTVAELHELNRVYPRENAEYWFKSPHTGAIDQHALGAYHIQFGPRLINSLDELRREQGKFHEDAAAAMDDAPSSTEPTK